MSQERDAGIVLSKKSSGEADNICTIYTRNSGKERFAFRGLKKSTRRPRTASEPGTILDLIYYTGKAGNIHTVSEFDILTSFNSIRKESRKIYALYFMLELTDMTTGFSDPNSKIFSLLSAGIRTLSETIYPEHFTIFFTVKYLLLQGIFPDTGRCSWCGNENADEIFIENNSFRASCINCTSPESGALMKNGTGFINQCVNLKLDKIDCALYPGKDINPALTILIEYINSYYNIKMKTGSMLTMQGAD